MVTYKTAIDRCAAQLIKIPSHHDRNAMAFTLAKVYQTNAAKVQDDLICAVHKLRADKS